MRKNLSWWGYVLMLPLAAPAIVAGGWVIDRITDMPAEAQEQTQPLPSGLTVSRVTAAMTIRSEYYTFEPRPDITAYEVAQALDLVTKALACRGRFDDCGFKANLEGMPPETKRHFVKHGD